MKKALFLDRDGIVNEDSSYVYKKEDIIFCEGIFDFCRQAGENGYLLIIVTNQAGVARGYFTEEDVHKLHGWMKEQFKRHGVQIDDIFYCPFHEKGRVPQYTKESYYRKPQPGMIIEAAEKWSIDLDQSIMVGDKPSDRIKLPNLRSYIIKSRYTKDDYDFDSLESLGRFLFRKA
ncbi:MAG: D-glycero-alpha-D-manno-heptose-1,7-bisphosphate 7-phosphatase [Chitinispirillaceae bacterium]